MKQTRCVSAFGIDPDSRNLLESATRLYLASKGWVFQERDVDADVVFVDAATSEGREFLDKGRPDNAARVVRIVDADVGGEQPSITRPLRYRTILSLLTAAFDDRDALTADASGVRLLDILDREISSGLDFRLVVDDQSLRVEPQSGFFYSPNDWRPTPAFFKSLKISTHRCVGVESDGQQLERRWKLQSLRFNAALHATDSRTNAFAPAHRVRLKAWPDLGELHADAAVVRLCAMLHANPSDANDLAFRSGLSESETNAFLFACSQCGLLEQAASGAANPARPETTEATSSIFAAIRLRLFG